MAHIYERVISLITKPPDDRHDIELEEVVPWFKKKAEKLFKDIQNQIIKDIVKQAEFRKCQEDDVIIRQGDIGDEFFIVMNGSASVHINSNLTEDEVEAVHRKQIQEEAAIRVHTGTQDRRLDRSLYGILVGEVGTGKSFGELALIHPESTRNATIIANHPCDLLVVSRDLYNKTLHAFQAKEYAERQKFVQDCPLFHKWNARYRKMAAMSLVKSSFKFEDVIVKQGTLVDGLHFVVSGQVKLRVDPSTHPAQYPQHFPVGDIADLEKQKARELLRKEMNLERHRRTGKKSAYERRTAPQDGRRSAQRPLELCLMGAVDTIGDLEMVMGLNSYSQTIICTEEATIFHLDQRNYDRLVEKKNPQTVDIMRDIVHTKLTLHFSRLTDDSIPLYRYFLYTLDEKERDAREKRQQQQRQQNTRGRPTPATATTTETSWHIDNLQKGPLVNLYGPGSVFYLIRMKAKERQQKQQRANATNPHTNPAFRFGKQQQSSPLGRTPLADNSRFLYADDTSSISDGHIVNIYGYNDNIAPRINLNDAGEPVSDYDYADAMYEDDYDEEEDVDWATSDVALSNLEERLMQWHNSFTSTSSAATGVPAAPALPPPALTGGHGNKGGHCVVRLHRYHCDEENRPKPGNKVYVRGRDNKLKDFSLLGVEHAGGSTSPETEKSFARYLSASHSHSPQPSERQYEINSYQTNDNVFEEDSPKPLLHRRANSAGKPRRLSFPHKKSKPRHQYTPEEYQALKDELRRRQRAYKSFLPQRSNTVLF
ncbi:hypothetical protein BaRGS_00022091 [Batillaria attramentaria]|uniref:Cyclic nucleotide-binding domain-containing protein n=1 Tax=Batillaria attramentaria TaxID=370345 RepID=A0ABD0KHK7_9CAEN